MLPKCTLAFLLQCWVCFFIIVPPLTVYAGCICTGLDDYPTKEIVGPVTDVTSESWKSKSWSYLTTENVLPILLRSSNAACKVEMKIAGIDSPGGLNMLVYPGGRNNRTGYLSGSMDFQGQGYASLCCQRTLYLGYVTSIDLGKSIVSDNTELAIWFDMIEDYPTSNQFELNIQFRQLCDSSRQLVTLGLALSAPKSNGEVIAQLALPGGILGRLRYYGAFSGIKYWTIPKPASNCSIELNISTAPEFTNPPYSRLHLNREIAWAYAGVIYLFPVNSSVDLVYESYAQLNFTYTARCPGNVGALPRVIFNERTLTASDYTWKNITFTFDGGEREIFVWKVVHPPHTDGVIIQVPEMSPSLSRERYYSFYQKYAEDYFAVMTPKAANNVSVTFSVRALSRTPTQVAIGSSWQTFSIDEPYSTRWNFDTTDKKACAIEFVCLTEGWFCQNYVRGSMFPVNSSTSAAGMELAADEYWQEYNKSEVSSSVSSQGIHSYAQHLAIVYNLTTTVNIPFSATTMGTFKVRAPHCPIVQASPEWKLLDMIVPAFQLQPAFQSLEACPIEFLAVYPYGWFRISAYISILCRSNEHNKIQYENTGPGMNKVETKVILADCKGPLLVRVSADDIPQVAFRSLCPGTAVIVNDTLHQYPPFGQQLLAANQWKSFSSDTGRYLGYYGKYETFDRPRTWTIQASSSHCRINLKFDWADMGPIEITEDITTLNKYRILPHSGEPEYTRVKSFASTSCGPILYVIMPLIPWTQKMDPPRFTAHYQQDCAPLKRTELENTAACGQNSKLHLFALPEWQTISFNAINLEQVLEHSVQIDLAPLGGNATDTSVLNRSTVIELVFDSVVQQVVWGTMDHGYDSWRGIHDSTTFKGVFANSRRAIVGESMMFHNSVTIIATVMAQSGDHLFTVRFRSRLTATTRKEIFAGEQLIAENVPKVIDFKIPQQFSKKMKDKLVAADLTNIANEYGSEQGDYYMPDRVFNIWSFQHRWTIKASNPDCHVSLKFVKMDIGSGIINSPFRFLQRRLSVAEKPATVKAMNSPSITCNPDSPLRPSDAHFFPGSTKIAGIECARLNTNYVSNETSLVLMFRSSTILSAGEEYEYEVGYEPDPQDAIYPWKGAESTWGTGWQAQYSQVCPNSDQKTTLPERAGPFTQTMYANSTTKWTAIPFPSSKKTQLFLNYQFVIKPANPSSCRVTLKLQTSNSKHQQLDFFWPVVILENTAANNWVRIHVASDYLNDEKTFLGKEFRVHLLGTLKGIERNVLYQQTCDPSPTNVPTLSPETITQSPSTLRPSQAPSRFPTTFEKRAVGWSCKARSECTSGICSLAMMRCTSPRCSSKCSNAASMNECTAVSFMGCSCQWNPHEMPKCLAA